jgi:hypothetical protein
MTWFVVAGREVMPTQKQSLNSAGTDRQETQSPWELGEEKTSALTHQAGKQIYRNSDAD